jgi:ribonuclease VapC
VIVLDSSVLVGIVKGEADVTPLLNLLLQEDCSIGAPTLVEARIWCSMNLAARRANSLERLIESGRGTVIPFSREMADVASATFDRFGRASGHKAGLNFGDCMAYAVSAVMRAPLLFKGGDFGHTDVMPHPSSIPCDCIRPPDEPGAALAAALREYQEGCSLPVGVEGLAQPGGYRRAPVCRRQPVRAELG